jgi:flagellar hook protein FlgE
MLRSMFSGISGLRAHQQMMDVTGNNIANVNTNGFKTSQTSFQDTLSQMVRASGAPQGQAGGTNPAQIGLGVKLGSISTNFGQGAAQTTGKSTDLMIQGDGFFVVRSGGEQLYTRAGSFDWDSNGSLVTSNGNIVQGWMGTNGVVNTAGTPGNITLPLGQTIAPQATANLTLAGNLSAGDAVGASKEIQTTVFSATGAEEAITLTFTKSDADTWQVELPDGSTANLDFAGGKPTASPLTIGGFSLDVSAMSSYSGATAPQVNNRDGSSSGTLASYTISQSGEIIGVFSNGLKQALGQIALANFNNVNGLEKVGNSMFRTTVNSGLPQVGTAGTNGLGAITGGTLEMSNVDLAQEFTNLVIAQRGFQANSRVITTSDELLQELVNLKR